MSEACQSGSGQDRHPTLKKIIIMMLHTNPKNISRVVGYYKHINNSSRRI